MMRKNRLEDFEAISEINVTPFVDVLLVLLVIFMITAPLFTKAIDVRLPQEKIKSSNVTEARKWVVAIDARGRYYLNGEKI
ncbi:MAG: biopolymer transporter ExbD, partial [Deltaproteobacteria bacterium]|nr:biopolymer transporter ExbD [Deltaproteobacteria bacterium]